MNRYQGLVALDVGGLEAAAHEYFLRSEQIPTKVRLAVAEELLSVDGSTKKITKVSMKEWGVGSVESGV